MTLLEEFITTSVQNERASIRKEAILALTCCCLRSIDSARQHMLLLLQVSVHTVHHTEIQIILIILRLLTLMCTRFAWPPSLGWWTC